MPGDPFARFPSTLRMSLEEFVPTDDRLCLGKCPVDLGRSPGVLTKRKLPSRSGEVSRFDTKRCQATSDPGPDTVDPCAKLPAHPVRDRPVIQRISAQPCPGSDRAIRCFGLHHNPERRCTK